MGKRHVNKESRYHSISAEPEKVHDGEHLSSRGDWRTEGGGGAEVDSERLLEKTKPELSLE